MKHNVKKRIVLFSLLSTSLLCLLLQAGQTTQGPAQAGTIMDASGLKGGLVVHLHCGNGALTASLAECSNNVLVRGLTRSRDNLEKAQKTIARQGVPKKASVSLWSRKHLPFINSTVNLVVTEKPLDVPRKEVMRVLAPRGVLLENRNGKWLKTTKPWPEALDEWTHFLHGPGNNAVAEDSEVGPPVHLQWITGPRHLRSHEHLNSVSALVSAGGRLFYIIDEGPTASVAAPPEWKLVARDAFNGVLLWKQAVGPWEGHFRLFRSGPPDIARRLVATGTRVYVTLGYGKKTAAFDAKTGNHVHTYSHTEDSLEIIHENGRLYVVTGTLKTRTPPTKKHSSLYAPSVHMQDKGITALDAATGELLWKRKNKTTATLMPTTLAAAGTSVYFQNATHVLCLNAETGGQKWRSPRPVHTTRLSWSTPTLVVHGGVVLSADGSTGGLPADTGKGATSLTWIMSDRDIRTHPRGDLAAFNAETGAHLWDGKSLQGFCNPGNLFVINGLVWAGANVAPRQKEFHTALDLRTGSIKENHSGTPAPAIGGHARCWRDKATENYFILGGRGIELVRLETWSFNENPWVRGTCQYGVMPCNGLIYSPPDSCACFPDMRLHGFTALAPRRPRAGRIHKKKPKREKGPAYMDGQKGEKTEKATDAASWPTYRADNTRSGHTAAHVPSALKPAWKNRLSGRITPPTAAGGRIFVSHLDARTLYALSENTGETIWSYTTGGAVDSPPTVWRHLLLFGCRDGFVYCLSTKSGRRIWRFRAAPEELMHVAFGALESPWPVHGSVLVQDGAVWFTAGRSSFLDGGLFLYALDAATGKCMIRKQLCARSPAKSPFALKEQSPPMLPDILSFSDETLYMGWTAFDTKGTVTRNVKPHLFSATGFLDATWWHRTYWQYGTWMRGGFGGWPRAARARPAGRILAASRQRIFGFGRSRYDPGNPRDVHAGHVGVVKNTYQDHGWIDHSRNPYVLYSALKTDKKGKHIKWRRSVPVVVRSMVLTEKVLFIAGPPVKPGNRALEKLNSAQSGLLLAVDPGNGTTLSKYTLNAPPVMDGMAATEGRLLIACSDGSVCCFSNSSN